MPEPQGLPPIGADVSALVVGRGFTLPPIGGEVLLPAPDLRTRVTDQARAIGLDPDLVHRLVTRESNYNPTARSKKGAIGVMQLMPDTAKELGVDATDPDQNIRGGLTYLQSLLTRYGGDTRKAVAAYNAGPGAVDYYGDVPPFPETQAYVDAIVGPESRRQAATRSKQEHDLVAARLRDGEMPARERIASAGLPPQMGDQGVLDPASVKVTGGLTPTVSAQGPLGSAKTGGRATQPPPGASPLDIPLEGVKQAAAGAAALGRQLATPQVLPTDAHVMPPSAPGADAAALKAGADILNGAMKAASPLIITGLITNLPATLVTLGVSYAAATATDKAAQAANATPEMREFLTAFAGAAAAGGLGVRQLLALGKTATEAATAAARPVILAAKLSGESVGTARPVARAATVAEATAPIVRPSPHAPTEVIAAGGHPVVEPPAPVGDTIVEAVKTALAPEPPPIELGQGRDRAVPQKPTTIDLGGMGGAVAANLYQSMFDRLKAGKLPEPFPAEQQSAFSKQAQQAYAAGTIKSPEDLQALANAAPAAANSENLKQTPIDKLGALERAKPGDSRRVPFPIADPVLASNLARSRDENVPPYVVDVPIASIVATQPTVSEGKVRKVLANPALTTDSDPDALATGIVHGDQVFLDNGTHRAIAAWARGDSTLPVLVSTPNPIRLAELSKPIETVPGLVKPEDRDAVQEPPTTAVDVRQPSRDGEAVGRRDAEPAQPAGDGQAAGAPPTAAAAPIAAAVAPLPAIGEEVPQATTDVRPSNDTVSVADSNLWPQLDIVDQLIERAILKGHITDDEGEGFENIVDGIEAAIGQRTHVSQDELSAWSARLSELSNRIRQGKREPDTAISAEAPPVQPLPAIGEEVPAPLTTKGAATAAEPVKGQRVQAKIGGRWIDAEVTSEPFTAGNAGGIGLKRQRRRVTVQFANPKHGAESRGGEDDLGPIVESNVDLDPKVLRWQSAASTLPAAGEESHAPQTEKPVTAAARNTQPIEGGEAETLGEPPMFWPAGHGPDTEEFKAELAAADRTVRRYDAAVKDARNAREQAARHKYGSKARASAESRAEAADSEARELHERAQSSRQLAHMMRLRIAVENTETPIEQRWAAVAKAADLTGRKDREPYVGIFDRLKAEAQRRLVAAGLSDEDAKTEAGDIANSLTSMPLSDLYVFDKAVPRAVARVQNNKAQAAALEKLKALEQEYGVQSTRWTREVSQAESDETRANVLAAAEADFKETKAKQAKADEAEQKQRDHEIDEERTEAQLLKLKGQLAWRWVQVGKAEGRWQPIKGARALVPGVPIDIHFFVSKPKGGGWVVTEEVSGQSVAEEDSREEAIAAATAAIKKHGVEKLRAVIAKAAETRPPKPFETALAEPKAQRVKKPVDTPAEAAEEVLDELEHTVDLKGAQTAADVRDRVVSALRRALPAAERDVTDRETHNAAARKEYDAAVDVWQKKRYAAREAILAEKKAELNAPGVSRNKADQIIDAALDKRVPLKGKPKEPAYRAITPLTLHIPGDGTFTIERTPDAINEVIRRVTRGGPGPWSAPVSGGSTAPWKGLAEQAAPKGKARSGGRSEASEGTYTEAAEKLGGIDAIRPIEFPELVYLVRDALDQRAEVARSLARGTARGQFQGGVIRVITDLFKSGNEDQLRKTFAHEIGHLVDWLPHKTLKRGNLLGRLFSLRSFLKGTFATPDGATIRNADIRRELQAFSDWWRPWDPDTASPRERQYRTSGRELYADALSGLLANPGELEARAPTFYKAFFAALDQKPDVAAAYFGLQEQLAGTREALIERRSARLRDGFRDGTLKALDLQRRRDAMRKAAYKNFGTKLRQLVVDRNAPLVDLVRDVEKQTGSAVPEDENPIYLLNELNYVGGRQKAFLAKHIEPIYERLTDAGIMWEGDFGEALFNSRVMAGDRTELANPLGLQPAAVAEMQARLEQTLGPDKWALVERSMREIRNVAKDLASEAHDEGLFTDDLHQTMQTNPAYAPFRVVEYLDEHVSWKVAQQKGTLKAIANPADGFVLKLLSTIRAIERNKASRTAIEFLQKQFPSEIQSAKTRWTGKGHEPLEPRDRQQGLVTIYKGGHRVGYYVDASIAASLNRESIGHNRSLMTALNLVTGAPIFRPLFTTFNPGFQLFNVVRDFRRFWRNTPGLSMARALALYREALPVAKLRAFGPPRHTPAPGSTAAKAAERLTAAEEAKILSVTYNDMVGVGADTPAEQYLETIFAQHGLRELESAPRRAPVVHQVMAVLDVVRKAGDLVETLPKMAAIDYFRGDQPIRDLTPQQRDFIRRAVGSPDFLSGGTITAATNKLFLYSNAAVQGYRSDYAVARHPGAAHMPALPPKGPGGGLPPAPGAPRPRTASGFWWKVAGTVVLPRLLMYAALLGLFGEVVRRILQRGTSEYDRTNYVVIPLGVDKENGVVMRLPDDETNRFLGAMIWKILGAASGDKDVASSLQQILSYAGGQLPSQAPALSAAQAIGTYVAGGNPMDTFRGRPVLTDDEQKARGWPAFKKFVGWEFQELGGGIVWKFYAGEDRPRSRTATQTVLDLPIVSNVVGRFIKSTAYGEVERLRAAKIEAEGDEARRRAAERDQVHDAVRTYLALPSNEQTDARERVLAHSLAPRPQSGETLQAFKDRRERLQKRLSLALLRTVGDPVIDTLLSSTSTEQKRAVLETAAQDLEPSEFRRLVRTALKEKVIPLQLGMELLRPGRPHAAATR